MKFTQAIQLHKEGTLAKKSGKRQWTIKEPFQWYIDYDKQEGLIVVGWGFTTDFGSIPRPLWIVFDPTDWLAYILHDYLYYTKGIYFDNASGKVRRLSRKECDRIMREAIIVEWREQRKRFVRLSAWLQYFGVRLGGWWNWYF